MPSTRSTLLLLLPFLAAGCSGSLSHIFELTQEEVQKKLEQKFPLQPGNRDQGQADRQFQLTISDPVVVLEEGKDQIGVRVNLLVEPAGGEAPAGPPGLPKPPALLPERLTGSATLYCTLAYDAKAKAIHLSEPKITELRIERLPGPLSTPLSRFAEVQVAKKFAETPLPLDAATLKDKAARTFLKSVTIRNGKLLVEVGW